MTRTATELTYTNGMHLLVKYANGERALWVEEPNARDDGHASYSMNDANERIDIEPTEDIDAIVADWKHNVEWVEGTDGEDVEHYA